MTRRTYVYDRDLDQMVQIRGEGSNYYEPTSKLQIIRDIDPYKAVATDVASGGPPVIGSRREHREFLRRNNYIEVGNENPISGARPSFDDRAARADRIADIRRAAGHPGGIYDRR